MENTLANRPHVTTEEDVRQLMEEVRRIPRLTPEQERELARRCAEGDEEALRQMVSANMGLVIAIARRYYNGAVSLQDGHTAPPRITSKRAASSRGFPQRTQDSTRGSIPSTDIMCAS